MISLTSKRRSIGKLNQGRFNTCGGKTETFISLSPPSTNSPVVVAARVYQVCRNVNKQRTEKIVIKRGNVPTNSYFSEGECVNEKGLSKAKHYHYPRNEFVSQRRRFFKSIAESFRSEIVIIAGVYFPKLAIFMLSTFCSTHFQTEYILKASKAFGE